MTLRPVRTTQRALLSTTSHFTGEWETDDVLLALAWPDFRDESGFARWTEGPASRSAFVLAFRTGPIDEAPGQPFPDYSPRADEICSYLSVLFGKRFDNHGLFESIGYFHVPDLAQYVTLCNHSLPQNSHRPRVDYAIPLNLAEIARIERLLLLDSNLDPRFLNTFHAAAKFYLQALQSFERDPEVAYLHLITVGEILSGFFEFDDNHLMDERTTQALARVREGLDDGDDIACFLAGRMRHVKRRFVETIMQLIEPPFFERSESAQPFARLTLDGFRGSVSAAYDLRSYYVHTGRPFGSWMSWSAGIMEVLPGKPVLKDKSLAKALGLAPTYFGLERIIRCCLLRFAQSNGAYLYPGPDASGNT